MRFDIYPYCTVSLAFCWCQFELLVEGYVGLTSPFSGIRHNVGLTSLFSGIWHNDLAEARAQATSTQSPANQPMRALHHHPNLKTCFNHLMRICRCSSEKFSRVKPSQGTHLNSIKKRKIGKKLNSGGNNSYQNNSTIFLAFQSDLQNYLRLHDKEPNPIRSFLQATCTKNYKGGCLASVVPPKCWSSSKIMTT